MEYGTHRGTRTVSHADTVETKPAFKTTEFWIYVVILLGLLIAGLVSDAGTEDAVDGFGAERVWLYAVILTGAYMISRGIAKSGNRTTYTESADGSAGESIGDRVKAAAHVLREGEGSSSGSTASSTAATREARSTHDPTIR